MTQRPQANQACKAIAEALTRAAEHVEAAGAESVVIIATFTDNEGMTHHRKMGRGNYFAQRGSVIDWIDATRETPPPKAPPEEEEWWKGE